MTLARKTRVFWPLLLVVLLSDCTKKRVAVASLESPGTSQQVLATLLVLVLMRETRMQTGSVPATRRRMS